MIPGWITILVSLMIIPASDYGLSLSQQDFFNRNGYLIIKNLIPRYKIDQIAHGSDEAIEKARQLAAEETVQSSDIKLEDNGTQYVFSGDMLRGKHVVKRIVWVGSAFPTLLKLGEDPLLTVPVGQLLKSNTLHHLINQIHPKLPGDGVQFRFHRDIESRRKYGQPWTGDTMINGGFIQTLVAIDNMNKGNGGIEIYPRSHYDSDGLKSITDQKKCEIILQARYGQPLIPDLKPGDALFFHPNVAHRSLSNLSHLPRRVFINGFAAEGANPGIYPGAGSGNVVYVND